MGRHLETTDNIDGAIAAFKRAAQLDPRSADIVAELAGLYMRQSRLDEAIAAGEQALKVAPANREAHRVLGIVYATLVESGRRQNGRTQQNSGSQAENLAKAIQHLEQAVDRQSESDPNVRATLSRLYLAAGAFDKAIPLLVELVSQEPGWSDGPTLLAQAYAGAGRDGDAISWLERAAAGRSRPVRDARGILRARAAMEGCGRRVRARARGAASQRRSQGAVRVGVVERRRRGSAHQGARAPVRSRDGAAERRALAVSAVAGASVGLATTPRLKRRRGVSSR